jgi:putative drug exporter of the RND superfamily
MTDVETSAPPRSRFGALGRSMYRRRRLVVILWVLCFAFSIPALLKVEEPLKLGGFSSDKTEAARARQVVERELSGSASQLVVIFRTNGQSISSDATQEKMAAAVRRFTDAAHVTDMVLPSENPAQMSANDATAYALISLDLPAEDAQRLMPEFEELITPQDGLDILLAGGPAFYADIETVSQRDLQRAEVIAFPFALVALIFVFGTLVSAFVPLVVGGLGVAAVLTTIFGLAHVTDLSIFVLNLSTMLGLGLAIDYSLFITSRFREELPKSTSVERALQVTMTTAGRAIFFSGLTVLIGLSGLILFDFMFLRSVGIAGVIVVFFSVTAALTLLPALLGIAGTNIERWAVIRRGPEEQHGHGFWARLSRKVMERPVMILIPTVLVLLAFGAPFRHVNISSPDATILPTSTESRQGFDELVEAFGPGEISPFVVVFQSPTSVFEPENVSAIHDLVTEIQSQPDVVRVEGFAAFERPVTDRQAQTLVELQRRAAESGVGARFNQFANENTAMVLIYPSTYANSPVSKDLLESIRSHDVGGDLSMLVDGGTAEIVDVVDAMYGAFPLAVGLVLVATYIVLFLLFHSVFLPLKAIVMNTLSLLASYGALVWVFQDGHLERALRFDSLGYVEASLPIIMFCILFGLSMDYEVFLLSRVREEWERTGNNTESVAIGLQRSGRIISSAALIVVVVAISFVSADVILVKALGFGIALAVFLDATIVRALLVPATMRLMGHWNWWRPAFLERFAIPEGGD